MTEPKPWDREDELLKSSKHDLVKRVGSLIGMGGDWGFVKLPKTTLVCMIENLEAAEARERALQARARAKS